MTWKAFWILTVCKWKAEVIQSKDCGAEGSDNMTQYPWTDTLTILSKNAIWCAENTEYIKQRLPFQSFPLTLQLGMFFQVFHPFSQSCSNPKDHPTHFYQQCALCSYVVLLPFHVQSIGTREIEYLKCNKAGMVDLRYCCYFTNVGNS